MRHIGHVARSARKTVDHQPRGQPAPAVPPHPCDTKKCWRYRHLGRLRMACHIASRPVTCDAVTLARHMSRHIRPSLEGGVYVTEGQVTTVIRASNRADLGKHSIDGEITSQKEVTKRGCGTCRELARGDAEVCGGRRWLPAGRALARVRGHQARRAPSTADNARRPHSAHLNLVTFTSLCKSATFHAGPRD
jgi:hypothetical protein